MQKEIKFQSKYGFYQNSNLSLVEISFNLYLQLALVRISMESKYTGCNFGNNQIFSPLPKTTVWKWSQVLKLTLFENWNRNTNVICQPLFIYMWRVADLWRNKNWFFHSPTKWNEIVFEESVLFLFSCILRETFMGNKWYGRNIFKI